MIYLKPELLSETNKPLNSGYFFVTWKGIKKVSYFDGNQFTDKCDIWYKPVKYN